MPELSAADVERYTQGRLSAGTEQEPNLEIVRLLAAGLAAARRHCGWHVTPIEPATVKRDGDGGRLLRLPTLRLVTFNVMENGVDITADVVESGEAAGCLYKASGAGWAKGIANIEVTVTHGFDEAPDFDAAVLSWVDRASLAPVGGRARVIGPFQYPDEPMAVASTFTASERSLLDQFRLERAA